ncbi:MAG: ATPase [Planctomycetes bacterium]|nr:ATPase [Planctomycetota bacterium]
MFIGRERELGLLKELQQQGGASLVVCRGRRRIGKSTLIQESAKDCEFINLYGLAPREGVKRADQLAHFGELVGLHFGLHSLKFSHWNEAFDTLSNLLSKVKRRKVVLLDEISWMASGDRDFPGKLKGMWDTRFKKLPNLTMVLCGSITSWINDNILHDKGFVGRVSLTISLGELSLAEANAFWGNKRVSSSEKLKVLSVTGGVPRYLEEVQTHMDAGYNIKRMCFTPEGFLYSEFDQIFKDIFEKKNDEYQRIIEVLKSGALEYADLARALKQESTGGLSKKVETLQEAGFIKKDYCFNQEGKRGRRFKIRICDNYIRYYIKYIYPRHEQIQNHLLDDLHLEDLSAWDAMIGLQFENLVLNNLKSICDVLQLAPSSIMSASPYYQKKTKQLQACQVDLLIQTKKNIYPCEVKFKDVIDSKVAEEMEDKLSKLKNTSRRSIRPVLIYHGDLKRPELLRETFQHFICFDDLLKK